MRTPARHALALASLMLLSTSAARSQGRATFEILPTLGGNSASASAINDLGQVVGSSTYAAGNSASHAFVWQQGVGLRALGDMGSFVSQATAINNAGQVVGAVVNQEFRMVGVTWKPMQAMSYLERSDLDASLATGVNASGQIVGWGRDPQGFTGAMLWQADGSLVRLSDFGFGSSAAGINDAGTVVGETSYTDGPRAVQWQTSTSTAVQSLPSLSGNVGTANSINNAGQVAGNSRSFDGFGLVHNPVATRWAAEGGVLALADVSVQAGNSVARGINSAGQVVGQFSLEGQDGIFVSNGSAPWASLGAFGRDGWAPLNAQAINRHAQVVGTAHDGNGGTRAYLLNLHPDWNGGDGRWDDPAGSHWNWAGSGTAAAMVGRMHDVVIDPGRSLTVTGSSDGQANTLRIGGSTGSLVTLDLAAGHTSTQAGTTVAGGGVLRGDGRLSGDLLVEPGGRVQVDGGQRQQLAAPVLVNAGSLRVQGTAAAPGQLEVTGQTATNEGSGRILLDQATVSFESGLVNHGQVSLQSSRASFDNGPGDWSLQNAEGGQVIVSFGTSAVSGTVNNGGQVIVSNGAQVSFFDAIRNDGELRVSAGGAANFFGRVSGLGQITGTGQARFEGGLAVGASPGIGVIDPETLITSLVEMELGGTTAGQGVGHHDKLVFNGMVTLAGAPLQVLWWGGFAGRAGDSFDLFDWNGGILGEFSSLALPTLGDGLAWNTQDLYANGVLSIAEVPEPGSSALMTVGVLWLARRSRLVRCLA